MQYDNDPSDGMTEQEFDIVKKLVEEGNLSLSIELWEEEPRVRFSALIGSCMTPVARVSLQALISHDIFVTSDIGESGGEDVEEVRSHLFTLAGRLRELARIAEEQAGRLNRNIANWRTVPDLEPVDDSEEA